MYIYIYIYITYDNNNNDRLRDALLADHAASHVRPSPNRRPVPPCLPADFLGIAAMTVSTSTVLPFVWIWSQDECAREIQHMYAN